MAARLDLNVDVDKRDSGGGDAGNAAGLREGARAHALKLFLHLTREAADGGVVEPLGDRALFGLLQALDGALLLLQIAGVFDFDLDGFELVADGGT